MNIIIDILLAQKSLGESIGNFFEYAYEAIATSLKSRINDNFYILYSASSF